MSLKIEYNYFLGGARERSEIEQAISSALERITRHFDSADSDWLVRVDEYLSAPIYSIEISGPILLSQLFSKDDDISSSLTRVLLASIPHNNRSHSLVRLNSQPNPCNHRFVPRSAEAGGSAELR